MSDATQPAADLEREANILASAWLGSILPKDEGTLLYVERQELLTIRAALARERELREALREYGWHRPGCQLARLPDPRRTTEERCSCGFDKWIKALLAQPAETTP